MTKYDKVYVEKMDSPDRLMVGKWNEGELTIVADAEVKILPNVIVCSIEELRDIWNAGRQHLREAMKAEREDEPELIVSPNFETYLTSKGIEIN